MRFSIRLAGYWLLAEGGIGCLISGWTAVRFGLRFAPEQIPYYRSMGLAQLCLGVFILKALDRPERQYLAVDLLILFLLGNAYFLLNYRLSAGFLTGWEWFALVVQLFLGGMLALNRTRSGDMQGGGSLVSKKAWKIRPGSKGPLLGELDADGPKSTSEAVPHLD